MAQLQSITDSTAQWASQRQIALVLTPETDSTNTDAKENAFQEAADCVLYLTAHQNAGRGRGQNTWLDTGSGESLLCTWSFHVPASPQAIAAPRIGLAVFEAVSSAWPSLQWSLKAPNDLFLEGLKVGGLLVESVSSGNQFRLLIGLGFNVLNHPRRFNEANHLGNSLHDGLGEGEWFQFLDELRAQLIVGVHEAQNSTLSNINCLSLERALNANPAKPFTVTKVSPQGDLLHSTGQKSWMDI